MLYVFSHCKNYVLYIHSSSSIPILLYCHLIAPVWQSPSPGRAPLSAFLASPRGLLGMCPLQLMLQNPWSPTFSGCSVVPSYLPLFIEAMSGCMSLIQTSYPSISFLETQQVTIPCMSKRKFKLSAIWSVSCRQMLKFAYILTHLPTSPP